MIDYFPGRGNRRSILAEDDLELVAPGLRHDTAVLGHAVIVTFVGGCQAGEPKDEEGEQSPDHRK
jgi:hypothetical protein